VEIKRRKYLNVYSSMMNNDYPHNMYKYMNLKCAAIEMNNFPIIAIIKMIAAIMAAAMQHQIRMLRRSSSMFVCFLDLSHTIIGLFLNVHDRFSFSYG